MYTCLDSRPRLWMASPAPPPMQYGKFRSSMAILWSPFRLPFVNLIKCARVYLLDLNHLLSCLFDVYSCLSFRYGHSPSVCNTNDWTKANVWEFKVNFSEKLRPSPGVTSQRLVADWSLSGLWNGEICLIKVHSLPRHYKRYFLYSISTRSPDRGIEERGRN